MMVASLMGVMVPPDRVSEPLQGAAPSKASNTADLSVTSAVPLKIIGFRVPIPEAGINVNPGSTPGFCHYTGTGNDGTS